MNKYKVADAVLTIIVIVIAVAAVTAGVVFAVMKLSAPEAKSEYISVPVYGEDIAPITEKVDKTNEFAVYFKALAPFSGVSLKCVECEGFSLDISVYAFDTDYATTLTGKKLRNTSFSSCPESAELAAGFAPLDAGEYLIVFSSGKNATFLCSYTQSPEAGNSVVVYKNRELLLNCTPYVTVIFSSPPESGIYFN